MTVRGTDGVNGCPHSTSVTFVVPAVEFGYWVDVCADSGCTNDVGDLIGAVFAVVATPLEARLLSQL